MILDLNNVGSHSSTFELEIAAGDVDLEEESVSLVSDVTSTLDASRSDDGIDLKGRFDAELEIDCVRCLEPARFTLPIDFDVRYVPPEQFAAPGEHSVGGTELTVDVIEGETLDLADFVREQILLNLPEQPFCQEDCKGLCQKCGANLNLIDCKCKEAETDPRWAALADLK